MPRELDVPMHKLQFKHKMANIADGLPLVIKSSHHSQVEISHHQTEASTTVEMSHVESEASTTDALQTTQPKSLPINISSVMVNQSADWLTLFPSHTLPVTANCSWVQDLRQATQLAGPQITLLICNKQYLNVLANWLAHAVSQASLPVRDILTLSLDITTHQTLTNKGFQSLFIPQQSIMQPGFIAKEFSNVWITRMTVIRLLNSWKYSVLVVDSDALVLKDIQPLLEYFNNSDIIGSSGTYPKQLQKKWKTTLCMGVALFRATPATEHFWHMMKIKNVKTDDQVAVNYVFYHMRIKWKLLKAEIYQYYQGITSNPVSLQVTLLPNNVICRHCTNNLKEICYIWHPYVAENTGSDKQSQMTKDNTWILQDNWNETLQDSATANEWLLSITK
ncbi:uncharacterized protein [Dysidea avara]|uniref:uncharacterized protein isoform X2 n=1 Tax=Dysidea avara TaxID=196820 RepID=UPI0033334082